VYFHFCIKIHAVDLQGNLLKANPNTLWVASEEIISCRRQGCVARKIYSLGGATYWLMVRHVEMNGQWCRSRSEGSRPWPLDPRLGKARNLV